MKRPTMRSAAGALRIASSVVFAISFTLSGIAGADSRVAPDQREQRATAASAVSEAAQRLRLPVGASWHFDTKEHSQEVTVTVRLPTGQVKRISFENHKASGHSILIEDVIEPTLDILCKNVSRRICHGRI